MNSSTRVAGTAAIFLRPLRYMFDVETDVQVETEEDSTALLPFDTVHVHLRAATRPPLMERDELLNGFLRAETLIYTTCSPSNGSRNVDKYNLDLQDSKEEYLEDESDGGERTLSSLRGTYIWVLVRLQPLDRNTSKFILSDVKHTETLRVQYQLSPSSESFCLPVDHTNVVKILVTDELIDQVDAKMLQFTFLSVSLSTAEAPETKNVEAKASAPTTTSFNYSDAALAASEAAAAEEIRRRQRVEAELAEAKSAAQAKDRERLDAQIQAKQDAQRAQELELARNEQVYARSLLEQELAVREQQNQELKQVRKQLEDQLQATSESAQHFQVNINSTDQALEMLKQRAISDAKEREELQRRLRTLEEEKLALQNKSQNTRHEGQVRHCLTCRALPSLINWSRPRAVRTGEKESVFSGSAKPGKMSVNDFELVTVIGRGACGTEEGVGDEQGSGHADLVTQTMAERRILQEANHPYIVQLKYAFQNQDKLYMVMEYYSGGSLRQVLRRRGRFSIKRARFYLAEILLAIAHLHGSNILYRDLKHCHYCGRQRGVRTKDCVNYETGIAKYSELAKGQMMGAMAGGTLKILFDPDTLKVFGVHAIEEGATEVIHIGQMAMAMGCSLTYFRDAVFNYPTLAEAYRVAALNGLGRLNSSSIKKWHELKIDRTRHRSPVRVEKNVHKAAVQCQRCDVKTDRQQARVHDDLE
ncbi:hypothetical protein PC123_g5880 [Phytophthora cactorum]|nr:hypothetical protein PC123_g5880 [Phytophthora cactorum]